MAQINIAELEKWKLEILDELGNLKSKNVEKEVEKLQSRLMILSKVDLLLTGAPIEQATFQKEYLQPVEDDLQKLRTELEDLQNQEYQKKYLLNKILNEIDKQLPPTV